MEPDITVAPEIQAILLLEFSNLLYFYRYLHLGAMNGNRGRAVTTQSGTAGTASCRLQR